MPSPQPLEYAPPVPWHANRTLRRWGVICAAGVMCILLARWTWTGYLRDRLAFSRAWHRSETFVEPPTIAVYTSDPSLIPKLLASGYSSGWNIRGTATDAYHSPAAWRELVSRLRGNGFRFFDACAFLHSRSASGQPNRLIAVHVHYEGAGDDRLLIRIQPESFPESWPPPMYDPLDFKYATGLEIVVTLQEPFTLFAGQADPADPSRFTIGYTVAGKPGTIDGRLGSDGTAKLTIRDGPLLDPERPTHQYRKSE